MKTILVTGSNGLLGQKITEQINHSKQFRLIATGKGPNRFPESGNYEYVEMDILDAENVKEVVERYKPDAIINAAAMTNVDTCQEQQVKAYELNVKAVKFLVALCENHQIQLVQLSTDFIFDGAAGPYDELATPQPLSYYGHTKLEAEQLVQQAKCPWTIIRTVLVYGIVSDMSRSNIVLWAKTALEKGVALNVVNDQWRTPTLAEDLATGCLLAVEKNAQGVYHISGKDMMSIAEIVRKVAVFFGLDASNINEVSGGHLQQPAMRPARTGFIIEKARRDLGYEPHSFEEGMAILNSQLLPYTYK